LNINILYQKNIPQFEECPEIFNAFGLSQTFFDILVYMKIVIFVVKNKENGKYKKEN
jgi:hypothetical protein